jgi:hypothetical protein
MTTLQLNTHKWVIVRRNGVVSCFTRVGDTIYHARGGADQLLMQLAAGEVIDGSALELAAPKLHQLMLAQKILIPAPSAASVATLPSLLNSLLELRPSIAEAAAHLGMPDEWSLPQGPRQVRMT